MFIAFDDPRLLRLAETPRRTTSFDCSPVVWSLRAALQCCEHGPIEGVDVLLVAQQHGTAGPGRVLCVVVEMTVAWPTGEGWAPPTMSLAMCAVSATRIVSTSRGSRRRWRGRSCGEWRCRRTRSASLGRAWPHRGPLRCGCVRCRCGPHRRRRTTTSTAARKGAEPAGLRSHRAARTRTPPGMRSHDVVRPSDRCQPGDVVQCVERREWDESQHEKCLPSIVPVAAPNSAPPTVVTTDPGRHEDREGRAGGDVGDRG